MAKFSFDWKVTVYYNAVIEADTIEDAKRMFHSNKFNNPKETDRDFDYVTRIEEIE